MTGLAGELIGFDLREPLFQADPRWDSARRSAFLLRTDVPRPLSTDNMVWPSVFDTGQGIGLAAAERQRLGLAGIPTPEWIGPNAGLWDNLPGMLAAAAAGGRPLTGTEACTRLAVTWLSEKGLKAGGPVGPYAEPTVPGELSADWQPLGFDVADGSLCSGLSNCGYRAEEIDELRQRWAGRLNAHHLFDEADAALEFRDLCDARVPEHAPFFVYGLYSLLH